MGNTGLNTSEGPIGKLPITVQEAMSRYFESNACLGQGDMRAAVTLEALQRSEHQDFWVVNRKKLSRVDVMEITLDLVASGYSIPAVLSITGMPKPRTFIGWTKDYSVFADLLEKAEEMRSIVLAEQALEIVDAPDPTGKLANAHKNQAEIRMRLAESMNSKRYGKKQLIDVTHREDLSGPEVWSRFTSVLKVHRDLIEKETGIKILLPEDEQSVITVIPEEEKDQETDPMTLGMSGKEEPWLEDLDLGDAGESDDASV